MAPVFLFDTNAASDLLKGQVPELSRRFAATPPGRVAVSAITEAELRYGIERKPEAMRVRIAVEALLASIPVLAWGTEAARAYGKLRALQERKGLPMSAEDLMIAAHALSCDMVLVTRNHAFRFVDGLHTQDWTAKFP